jgi:hypothetical protein
MPYAFNEEPHAAMTLRSTYDPLAPSSSPRWLVSMTLYRQLLAAREIPAGTDLGAVLQQAAAEMVAAGWELDSDSRQGYFFARCGHRRVQVGLQVIPPNAHRRLPTRTASR